MRSEKHTAVVAEGKSLPDSFGVARRVAAASAAAAKGDEISRVRIEVGK